MSNSVNNTKDLASLSLSNESTFLIPYNDNYEFKLLKTMKRYIKTLEK